MIIPPILRHAFAWLALATTCAPSLLLAAEGTATGRTYTFKKGVNISHWLSQNGPEQPYAAAWFDEEDVAWIAAQGFDHIRYPVDGREDTGHGWF